MSEALNAETVLASIVELRENFAEQGRRMDEQWKRSEQAAAELRANLAEQGKRSEQAAAELRANLAEQGKRMDERWKRSEQAAAKLRANLAEQGKRMDEQGKRMDEQGKRMDEQGKRIDKLCERMDEQNKHFAKALEKLDENNAKLDENNRNIGKLTNKYGSIIERIVIPGVVDKFNEKGFKFDSVSANVEFLNEKKDGNIAEVDALLENGKFVIAVETKTELKVSDVNAHIKRLQALRKNVSRFKGKKIYGAFSTAIVKKRPINYALDKGFYVLQQPDVMSVRIIDFPKGRFAKAW